MRKSLLKFVKDAYVPNEYQLTPYLINDDQIHPAAIICPGGGYFMVCDYMEGKPIAKDLNAKGINAFVLRYAFKERAHYPNPQDDLARAVKELIDNQDKYHIDMTNYSIWGFSAGGHLAATHGYEYKKYHLPKPNCLVLTYPVISLGEYTHRNTKRYLIGLNATQEEIDNVSVHKHIDKDYPKTFIWCGEDDASVPPINSKLLVDELIKNKIERLYITYPKVGHGVGDGKGTNAYGWLDKAVEFWLKK